MTAEEQIYKPDYQSSSAATLLNWRKTRVFRQLRGVWAKERVRVVEERGYVSALWVYYETGKFSPGSGNSSDGLMVKTNERKTIV